MCFVKEPSDEASPSSFAVRALCHWRRAIFWADQRPRPRSAPGELKVTFDALARNQPTPFLELVSATPATSQLLPLGLLAPSSAAQKDTCCLTTQLWRTSTLPGRPRMIHPIYAHSQSTLRLTTISLERYGAGCLCRRTAAVGSTILLTHSIAGARAERPGVKLRSLLSPRQALSEQRPDLCMRPSRVSACGLRG